MPPQSLFIFSYFGHGPSCKFFTSQKICAQPLGSLDVRVSSLVLDPSKLQGKPILLKYCKQDGRNFSFPRILNLLQTIESRDMLVDTQALKLNLVLNGTVRVPPLNSISSVDECGEQISGCLSAAQEIPLLLRYCKLRVFRKFAAGKIVSCFELKSV